MPAKTPPISDAKQIHARGLDARSRCALLTKDAFLDGRVMAQQPRDGYRAALDAVVLASAVPAKPGEAVLELGCGAGVPLLCLMARVVKLSATAIDIQKDMVALAKKNCTANKRKARIVCADVAALKGDDYRAKFDQVFFNPPYYDSAKHIPALNAHKRASKAMAHADLAVWIKTALRCLKSKGYMTAILPAETLSIVLANLKGFGDVEIIPLWPKAGRAAKRVIVRARKDRRGPMTLTAGLLLHESDGKPTRQAKQIMHEGRSFDQALSRE